MEVSAGANLVGSHEQEPGRKRFRKLKYEEPASFESERL